MLEAVISISAILIGIYLVLTIDKGNAAMGAIGSIGGVFNNAVNVLQGRP